MSERAYRQRLESDLARWEADGVITATGAASIRATFKPLPEGVTIATVVGIVGGLLIAAAFLAFIAANWTEVARPARFAILVAGIVAAYGVGTWFDRAGRSILADLAVGVGSIIFGAAIALTGQMYHLGGDFAAGIMLWAIGALAAAVLTGSRAALAVALVTACIWNGMRVFESFEIHLPFVAFWLIAAGLAVAWNAAVARHLVALAAIVWLVHTGIAVEDGRIADPVLAVMAGASLLMGAGLALASRGPESLRAFGLTLSTYASFALAFALAVSITNVFGVSARIRPSAVLAGGAVGAVLAIVAAGVGRHVGSALAGVAIGLALAVAVGGPRPSDGIELWMAYAVGLASMLCLVVSGMLDEVRPRVVAGWIGLGLAIAAITWAVRGSLLHRAVFLAVAGIIAVALASALGRLFRKEPAR
jgi:uncharacterized membrane protein